MSLHQLAHHMSARGRGPDSTLVHMTPREVEGLQKLAVAHGTSLTINPDTGLPEAFSLKDLLPTLAGAAINYFAPGFGTAIGGALGLSGAAGTGLAVGAATAAISGDLGKGLQAGLGAYGGAGITDSLTGMGAGYLGSQAAESAVADATAQGLKGEAYNQAIQDSVTNRMASTTMSDKLGAGLSYAGNNPMTALKTGAKYLGAAAIPILAGETGNTVQTVTPKQSAGSIRPFTYDPYYQEYTRGTPYAAAKGGSVGYAEGGMTLDQAYQNVLGRAPDKEGAKFWGGQFGDKVDDTELAAFKTSALGGTDTADKTAAQAFGVTANNAGAVGEVGKSNFIPDPALPEGMMGTMGGTGYDPVTGKVDLGSAGGSGQYFANAGTGTGLGAGLASLTNNTAANNTGTGATQSLGTNYAGQATSPLITDQVQDLYRNVLDRTTANNTLTAPEIEYWSGRFGADNKIDADEIKQFKDMSQGDITKRQASNTAYIPISGLDALYKSELGRSGEKAGMDFWKNAFGDYIDPTELAGFKAEAAKERAARPGEQSTAVVKPVVVTNLPTADSTYIAPGVSGSTGAGQTGGGTVINPNGTVTTSPRIPGIPVGGFTGMNQVRDAYTSGGGDLGYTSYAPKTIEEFNTKYKNTGYSDDMYKYLSGKGPYPTKMTDVDAAGNKTYREVMRPYNEATLGVPASTNKRLTWDKTKGEYFRNPDYVRTAKAPILDAAGARKRDADGNYLYNTTTYKSINQAKAGIADNKLTKDSGVALLDWATTNNVDEQTVADALGIPMQEAIGIFAKAKADKKLPAKKGGLMQLANGGMAYDNGGGVKADYIDSKGDTHVWDWENGMYRPEKLLKNNKSYTWDKVSNNYKLAAADAGLNSLLDTSGGGSPAGGENSSNPNWDGMTAEQKAAFYDDNPTFQAITLAGQKALGILGITNPLEAAIARGAASLSGFQGISNVNTGDGTLTGTNTNTGTTGGMNTGTTGGSPAQAGDIGNPGDPAKTGPDAGDYAAPAPTGSMDSNDVNDTGLLASGGMAGYAQGGLGSLGGYSDGGRLLRGPGDGVSDSIPASIGDRQPARLADGEFVVPARIVSELGNGSTEAGARALYKMMDRIQANRRKTTGKNSVAVDSKAHKYLPA